MGRSILHPRDGIMFLAKAATATQKSTDLGNYGKPVEVSEYNYLAVQVYWAGITVGAGTFKVQTSLIGIADADWVDKVSASVTTSGAAGTDIISLTNLSEKFVRVVWSPGTSTAGTVDAHLMAKSS